MVVDLGEGVTGVKRGDAVCLYPPSGCGRCEFCQTNRDYLCIHLRVLGERMKGTYAEYVKLPAENCFAIPPGISFEEAAALPLVFITAWRMLFTNAALRPGEHVLILGIGGGVATAVLQLAKRTMARIIVTSSSDEKLERAINLGAEHGINYRRCDFAKEVRALTGKRGVDVVVDCVGEESWVKSLAALAKGGRLVTCGATTGAYPKTDIRRIFWNHLSIFGSTMGSRHEFRQLLSFFPCIWGQADYRQGLPPERRCCRSATSRRGEAVWLLIFRVPDECRIGVKETWPPITPKSFLVPYQSYRWT